MAPRNRTTPRTGECLVNSVCVHLVEIWFSIVQRKVLSPAVANSLEELERRILAFEAEYRRQPRPVRWTFTREEFDRRLRDLDDHSLPLAA